MSGVTSERYRYTITCQPGQLACVYHVRGDVECLSECHRHGFRRLMKTSVYVDVDVMYFACAADHLHLEPVGGQRNIIETREYSRSANRHQGGLRSEVYWMSLRFMSVAWRSGRTLVFDRRAFAVLRSTYSCGLPLMWVNRPLQVSQLGQISLSSFRGR